MREFTEEEKELIANTPIDSLDNPPFDFENIERKLPIFKKLNYLKDEFITVNDCWGKFIPYFEQLRLKYLQTKDERYFIELVRVLPSSYKVVKL